MKTKLVLWIIVMLVLCSSAFALSTEKFSGYYALDESSGIIVPDSYSLFNLETLNSPTWTTGKIGNARK